MLLQFLLSLCIEFMLWILYGKIVELTYVWAIRKRSGVYFAAWCVFLAVSVVAIVVFNCNITLLISTL